MPAPTQPTDLTDLTDPTDRLHQLAEYCGIAVSYVDGEENVVQVGDSTLQALLAAFGVDTSSAASVEREVLSRREAAAAHPLPPVVAMEQGVAVEIVVGVPSGGAPEAFVELENAERRSLQVSAVTDPEVPGTGGTTAWRVALPADVPEGYHTIHLLCGSVRSTSHLVVSPTFLGFPRSVTQERVWGFATQLYGVPSRRSWGMGDLADLRELASWSGSHHGADYLLINPINAAAPLPPIEPSPYLPVSRRFFDPQYLRVEDIAEFAPLTEAELQRCAELRGSSQQGRLGAGFIDRDTAWPAKRQALLLVHAVARSADREAAFRAFLDREGDDLERYATWCVLAEHHGAGSSAWPGDLRDPASPAVELFRSKNRPSIDFHLWLQWQLDCQLAAVQSSARGTMEIGIVHDLPVGVHPDGADTWSAPGLFASTVSVGAPPDAFNQLGQDWSQHPWRPDELARNGYAPFRKMVAGILRHSGGLRIDHIIGLFRLWWIPAGHPATKGSYVRYDHEVLIGIAALEARRAGAVVIGEDLGTFEPAMQEYLKRRGIPGTSVLWFEMDDDQPLPAEQWREWCLASVSTHDLPPAGCFVNGDHVRLRHRLGLLAGTVQEELAREEVTLAKWISRLQEAGCLGNDPRSPEIIEALYRYLTLTPCRLLNVALSDATGDLRPQNLPGTTDSYPNWRNQIAGPDGSAMFLEDVVASPAVARLAEVVAGSVRGLATSTRSHS